jgi:ABC-2 type transport system ATP-binding protein
VADDVQAVLSEATASAPGAERVIEVADLVKIYKGRGKTEAVRAVDSISFAVDEGEFFGFLGPNGAGKTTTIRILATLARPTSGRAVVAGLDVLEQADAVRRRIGLAMQTVALENMLSGRENLELIGRLHRVPEDDLRRRVDELLDLMNLTAAAGRLAGTYSGGMRRRLDLATALVHRPQLLFLDEPTEGLDPQSRAALWDELVRINRAGTTMFLTTHYMEEADRLCDRLAIVDEGRIVIEGTPAELKRSVGADAIEISLDHDDGTEGLAAAQAGAVALLTGLAGVLGVTTSSAGVSVAVASAPAAVPVLLRLLEGDGLRVVGLTMREPSLDDVFLRYCGRHIRAEEADRPIDLGWWS